MDLKHVEVPSLLVKATKRTDLTDRPCVKEKLNKLQMLMNKVSCKQSLELSAITNIPPQQITNTLSLTNTKDIVFVNPPMHSVW